MKKYLFLIPLLFPSFSIADGYPAEWTLKKFGFIKCTFVAQFFEDFTCGEPYYQEFECERSDDSNEKVGVLVIGTIESDVANECSPVVSFDRVVQKRQ